MGEAVDSASSDWTTPITIMPVTGAPIPFNFEKKLGNMRWSAADFAVMLIVNCQPRSDPRQASTASAITIEPTTGLNMWL